MAEQAVSLLHGNSSNMERQDWRCEVILRYDNRGPVRCDLRRSPTHPPMILLFSSLAPCRSWLSQERLMYTSSQSRQKNGNAQYEDHIEFIQMKSHGGRVCDAPLR